MDFYVKIWHEDSSFYKGFSFATCEEMLEFVDNFTQEHPCEYWQFDYFVHYDRDELVHLFL